MSSETSAQNSALGQRTKRQCKGTNSTGQPCRAPTVGDDGWCPAHRPGSSMAELGRRGGKARQAGAAAKLPAAERESLRAHLRERLDHGTVLAAVERALGGGNESARVAAVKFLADLELYRESDRSERELRDKIAAEAKAHAAAGQHKLEQLVLEAVVGIVRGELSEREGRSAGRAPLPGWVQRLADNLDADTKQKIAELKAERERLDGELAKLRTEGSEFPVSVAP